MTESLPKLSESRLTTSRPRLSVVVVVYEMATQAERTLESLSASYQEGIEAEAYEVIVVENGSARPIDVATVESFGNNFSYLALEDPPPSPAHALNVGIARSKGDFVGLMIDGARLLSPGLLGQALEALEAFDRAVVATLGFHLGVAGATGDARRDEELLARIAWPENGYRLFDIASLAGSSRSGWLTPPAESNCLFLSRELCDQLGGFDEAFDLPGGGLVNHDFLARAAALPQTNLLCLLGEATFHQHHGGISTGAAKEAAEGQWQVYARQYEEIRGCRWTPLDRNLKLFGQPSEESHEWLTLSAELAAARQRGHSVGASTLAAANRLGHRIASFETHLDEKSRWLVEQQRELDAQRALLRGLEEQLGERTRWLKIQSDELASQRERLDALEKRQDASSSESDSGAEPEPESRPESGSG